MKVKDYSYQTFPSYDLNVDGIIDIQGKQDNLRVRLKDINYQDNCIIRLLYPNTILDEERKYPLVIHVQGSGWYKQDMNDHIFDFMPIVKSGFVYAIIECHSAPEYHFPKQVYDVKKAIRFIQNNFQDYPIDINNVFLSGDSSGGHLALLTLFTKDSHELDELNDHLIDFKGMIDLYGPTNFLTFNEWYSKYDWTEEKNCYDLMGEENYNDEALYNASPMKYLTSDLKLPPIIILHGSKDHVVPFTQSVELYNQLLKYNFPASLCRVNDADHGRSIFYVDDVYDQIIKFLNKYVTIK